MPELGEDIVPPSTGDDHPSGCLFCKESPRELKNYKTKHGMIKDEDELERSLWSAAASITEDSTVGPIYPLPGGKDPTTGWVAKPGALEDFEVSMTAAPHHIIPGKAAMAKSKVENWTREAKGKIKQDIGYSIDCALNGIFLPHLPEIYWTKEEVEEELRRTRLRSPPPPSGGAPASGPPPKAKLSQFYGKSWGKLSESAKQSAGNVIMTDTWLQMHYMDHGTRYDKGSPVTYDSEAKELCDQLEHVMVNFAFVCERSKGDDGKHYPPYALVNSLNGASTYLKSRITGHPSRWQSWVSPLARNFTRQLQSGSLQAASKGLVSRKNRR